MKKVSFLVFAVVFFLLFVASNATALQIWANGVNETSGWFDAEKDSDNTDDDLLCWAASAANILVWSGWNAGYANEDQIFDYLDSQTHDAGGWQSYGWNFWFDGTQLGGHFAGSSHTGYYTTAEYTAALAQDWVNDSIALDTARNWLENDYGVGLAVKDNCYHAVTLWGIDIDDVTGDYLGVWITDSDNSKYGSDPRPNTLNYYNVSYDAISAHWRLDGMCGFAEIVEMDALKMRPVPEPATMILMATGILGLAASRRKRSRKG